MSREENLLEAIFGPEVVEGKEGKEKVDIFVGPELRDAVSRKDSSSSLRELTEDVLSTLTPREKEIIKMRFGMDESGKERSLVEVGKHFNVTGERIRQIEAKALGKLRHPSRSRRLRAFLDQLEPQAESEQTTADLSDVIESVKKLTPELIMHLQSHEQDLEKMDPLVFEHLVAEFLAQMGFQEVRLVGKEWETSADIYAVEKVNRIGVSIRYFVEVKRHKNKIGIDVIDRVYGAVIGEKTKYGWNAAMIVSVVGFKDIKKYTKRDIEMMGIYLKDRDDLRKWLQDYQPNKGGLWLPDPRKSKSI